MNNIGHLFDGNWLWQQLEVLSQIGALSNGGVTRQALSDEERMAVEYLAALCLSLDCRFYTDAIGNLFFRREGTEDLPPVLVGSHIDTQPLGGRYDGAYGVLAGLAVLEMLQREGIQHRHPIEVVAWTNEEGGRFAPGAMGSSCFVNHREPQSLRSVTDADGKMLGNELDRSLQHLASFGATQRPFGFPAHCYLEAHIEQGPVLETEGLSVGIVNSIQGFAWYQFDVHGTSAHAGTTPRSARRDAFLGAVMLENRLREFALDKLDEIRFTVGQFTVTPGSPNTVPRHVSFVVDLRHFDAGILAGLDAHFMEMALQQWAGCSVSVKRTMQMAPVAFAEHLLQALDSAADELGVTSRRMQSGAFHDAAHLAHHCPSAMLFIPCEHGVSHNPDERITKDDATRGAQVLAQTIVTVAGISLPNEINAETRSFKS